MTRLARKQRGVALLLALVVVAIATVLAVLTMERSQRDLWRSQSIFQSERSYQYALGMETVAWQLIRKAEESDMADHYLDGAWTDPIDVPGGHVRGRVLDQSGRFNINALIASESGTRVRAAHQFGELVASLGLNPSLEAELADWLEGAPVPRPMGAGDAWYGSQNPPYRTAAQAMASVTELRWLRSMDEDTWEALAPHVTALPTSELRININTTTPEVLASFIDAMDIEQARRVLQDGPFTGLVDFRDHPELAGIELAGTLAQLTTASEWFLAHARVELDQVPRDYYRLLGRGQSHHEFRYFSIGATR